MEITDFNEMLITAVYAKDSGFKSVSVCPDDIIGVGDIIDSQQREIDELKAQNEVLIKSGNMMKVNLSYSDDPFSGGYISQWKRALSKSPAQYLLERDKRVIKKAFWWSAEFTHVVHGGKIQQAWEDYCANSLGGDK